ncbi:MAG: hypothetical protein AAGG57_07530 [Pseudomonadota bacterium]
MQRTTEVDPTKMKNTADRIAILSEEYLSTSGRRRDEIGAEIADLIAKAKQQMN